MIEIGAGFFSSMQKKGFTLIELIVVIAIIAILSILSYAPYNYYSNIAKVRFSAQKIEQAVSEARTSVIGGYSLSGGIGNRQNVHIALVFTGGLDTIEMRGYPATYSTGQVGTQSGETIRTISLENGVNIANGSDGIVLFLSPNGEVWTRSGTTTTNDFVKNGSINVGVVYKNATSGPLQKIVTIGTSVTIQ